LLSAVTFDKKLVRFAHRKLMNFAQRVYWITMISLFGDAHGEKYDEMALRSSRFFEKFMEIALRISEFSRDYGNRTKKFWIFREITGIAQRNSGFSKIIEMSTKKIENCTENLLF
jgi:hypothetical protein